MGAARRLYPPPGPRSGGSSGPGLVAPRRSRRARPEGSLRARDRSLGNRGDWPERDAARHRRCLRHGRRGRVDQDAYLPIHTGRHEVRLERGGTILAARYLIGAKVVDADGATLGHVIDMEIDPVRDFRVLGVELGRHGWIDRLRPLRPLAHDRLAKPPRIVPWADIDHYEDGKLVCKPGAQVREMAPTDEEEQEPKRTASGG